MSALERTLVFPSRSVKRLKLMTNHTLIRPFFAVFLDELRITRIVEHGLYPV